MAAPEFVDRVIEPPQPKMSSDESFRWLFDIWKRTGGFETFIVNLKGLLASVDELNTLVGVDTNTTVQVQLDGKVNTSDVGTMAEQDANNVDITGGSAINMTISLSFVSGNLQVQVGTSSVTAKCAASLHTDADEVGTINSSENELMSYELASDMLGNDGDYIDLNAWGTFAANANNKEIKLYFGSSVVFDTGAVAANAGNWYIHAQIIRQASADQKSIVSIISNNVLLPASSQINDESEDDTIPIIIKVTGQGTLANDIIQEGFIIRWFAAST